MRIQFAGLITLLVGSLFPLFVLANLQPTSTQPRIVTHIDTKQKIVALTFDADMTPKMLRRLRAGAVKSWYNTAVIKDLEDAHVPATLFLTGMWIETYATTTRELSMDPLFELGNHSYSHGGFTPKCFGLNYILESHDLSEVEKTDALLSKYAVRHVKLFRFPGLCFDKDDVAAVQEAGYKIIDGNVYGDDGFQQDANKIVDTVMGGVRPDSIIVLHMHGGPNAPETAIALPIIIQKLRAQGYSFVKVSDLLKLRM